MGLPLPPAIGAPVRSPTLIASSLTASGESARGTIKGEAGGCFKPTLPFKRADHSLSNLFVALVGEDSILDDCVQLMSHSIPCGAFTAQTITSRTLHPEHYIPNSIAQVW